MRLRQIGDLNGTIAAKIVTLYATTTHHTLNKLSELRTSAPADEQCA